MPSALRTAAAARLARQAMGDFGVLPNEPTKYQAIQPDAAAYNVFGPEYAKSLAGPSPITAADILNQRALHVNANAESDAYIQAIHDAQENQQYLQHAAAIDNANTDLRKHDLDTDINKGIGTSTVDQNTGELKFLPGAAAVQTAENMNTQFADRLAKVGGAVKDLGAAGYLASPETVGYMTTPAGQEKPTTTQENLHSIKLEMVLVVQMTAKDQTMITSRLLAMVVKLMQL
jgi:hypothetical protein